MQETCSEMSKNASDIADLLETVALAITNNDPDSFGGWVIDNTRANMAALALLEQRNRRPKWSNIGCVAHGTHSSMKDFANPKTSRGRYATDYGVQFIADTGWKDNAAQLAAY